MPDPRVAVVPRGAGSAGIPKIKWAAVRQHAGNHKVKKENAAEGCYFSGIF